MTKQHVSRRAFLAGSAASMALGSLAGVAHAATKPQEQWDEVFDVIVIGSGLAGMCAALAAKKNGCKKVVVLEKMSYLGGNSAIATGDFGAVNSQLTRKQGIKDTPEAFAEDISAACGGLNHPDAHRGPQLRPGHRLPHRERRQVQSRDHHPRRTFRTARAPGRRELRRQRHGPHLGQLPQKVQRRDPQPRQVRQLHPG